MSRHLLIAGTGRTGTSFLVRYLSHLGLDTVLSRSGPEASWNDAASAGLETLPLSSADNLPYVIKSPWTYQLIHDVLAAGSLHFDAVILPMRDLTDATASRSIVELRHMHEEHPWMGDLDRTWEQYGHTPGGIIYSINPVDQARLLAVGFHQLLERLTRAEITVILLSFPRIIEDADYLFRKLAPALPATITWERSAAAHAATSDPTKVHVETEITQSPPGFSLQGPGPRRLERAAFQRSLRDANHEIETLRTELIAAHEAMRLHRTEAKRQTEHRIAAETAFTALEATRAQDGETLRAVERARDALVCGHAQVSRDLERTRAQLKSALSELEQVRGSLRVFLTGYWPRLRHYLRPR